MAPTRLASQKRHWPPSIRGGRGNRSSLEPLSEFIASPSSSAQVGESGAEGNPLSGESLGAAPWASSAALAASPTSTSSSTISTQEVFGGSPSTSSANTTSTAAPAPTQARYWTSSEDDSLRALVQKYGTKRGRDSHWPDIAAQLPGRTAKACRKRWFYSLDPNLRKCPWTEEEDKRLLSLVGVHGKVWHVIASEMTGRSDDMCSTRYYNVLDPKLRRSKEWSVNEDARILELFERYGPQWKLIAANLPGRSALLCRNRIRKYLGTNLSAKQSVGAASSSASTHIDQQTRKSPRQAGTTSHAAEDFGMSGNGNGKEAAATNIMHDNAGPALDFANFPSPWPANALSNGISLESHSLGLDGQGNHCSPSADFDLMSMFFNGNIAELLPQNQPQGSHERERQPIGAQESSHDRTSMSIGDSHHGAQSSVPLSMVNSVPLLDKATVDSREPLQQQSTPDPASLLQHASMSNFMNASAAPPAGGEGRPSTQSSDPNVRQCWEQLQKTLQTLFPDGRSKLAMQLLEQLDKFGG